MAFLAIGGVAGADRMTLGRAVARRLGLPLLDLDTITNPVLDAVFADADHGGHWNRPQLRDVVRPARYAALCAAAADQRDTGLGAVLVAPFTTEASGGDGWDALTRACGEQPVLIWLVADPPFPDARSGERSDPREVDAPPGPEALPAMAHLSVDATLTTDQQLTRVLRSIGHLREVPRRNALRGRTFRAGLFDFDGTLVDSTASVHRAWGRLAQEFDLPGNPLATGHGQPAAQVIAASVPADRREAAFERIEDLESDDVHDVRAIEGSMALFQAVPLRAIVTSGTRRIFAARRQAAGLPQPDVVVNYEDVRRGKPDPEPFALAAARLGVPAADCVAFEDAPAGIAAARAAGCAVVAITGSHPSNELHEADVIVDRLDQLRVTQLADGFRLDVRSSASA